MQHLDTDHIRAYFPYLDHFIFFNHAGVSPLSSPVADAMRSLIEDVEHNASTGDNKWAQRETDLRRSLATLLNCEPFEIAITKNTGEGLSYIANGLDWKPGDNVVISNVEFPANAYPWLALERKGVEVRLARELEDGRIPLEQIVKLVDDKTRLVALSLVQYASGFRIPAEELGKFCRRRGILFVLDVFQAAGALRVDVQKLRADAAAGAFHKWLLGPEGIGFLFIRKEIMNCIDIVEWGWKSVITPYTSPVYRLEPKRDASRYECGTLNTYGIYGAATAIEFYLGVGAATVEQRLIELTDWLCGELKSLGCKVFSPRGPSEKSGIVSFYHPGSSAADIVRALASERIIVVERANRVRISPHYYNTQDELKRLLDVVYKCAH